MKEGRTPQSYSQEKILNMGPRRLVVAENDAVLVVFLERMRLIASAVVDESVGSARSVGCASEELL